MIDLATVSSSQSVADPRSATYSQSMTECQPATNPHQ
jgi:hypothetical protein